MGKLIQMNRPRPPEFDTNLLNRRPCIVHMPLGGEHLAYTDCIMRAGNYYEVYIPGRGFIDIRAEYVHMQT